MFKPNNKPTCTTKPDFKNVPIKIPPSLIPPKDKITTLPYPVNKPTGPIAQNLSK